MLKIQEKIVEVAKRYVGKKEISGNKGWTDKEFQKEMKAMGWQYGQPWCMYLVKLIWRKAYQELYPDNAAIIAIINVNITGGSLDTAARVRKWKDFEFSQKPQVGAIAIWQKTSNTGHGAVVIGCPTNSRFIDTVEGNTNTAGGRDGDSSMIKKRDLEMKSSLHLLGFVIPKEF
jgi:hypothetical protein